uniref:esterase C25G4.2-like isoform X2 n=1 Tax=Erigeron canadensis TaxID=72917 RepID=UPI001CB992AD|nr:esterase C25G4.2-like isoform X2 [Erigeron canadensis]
MDSTYKEKKSSMRRIPNISSTLVNNWHTITFLLLTCQNFDMVRPENAVDHGNKLPRSGFLQVAWTDGGAEQELNSDGVMSTTLNLERPGFQEMRSIQNVKKPRFLCLHGCGSNAEKLKQELEVWPESVTGKMDLVFINAPFPIDDETTVGEHFRWYSDEKVNTEYEDFEEGIAYIEDHMIELGPFDGLLGISQGLCLTKVGKIKHVILISGGKLGDVDLPQPKLAETAYDFPINIPSLHIYGEHDIARNSAPNLTEVYVDPLVIYHHGGHEVPKLDEEGLKIMFEFLKKINATI